MQARAKRGLIASAAASDRRRMLSELFEADRDPVRPQDTNDKHPGLDGCVDLQIVKKFSGPYSGEFISKTEELMEVLSTVSDGARGVGHRRRRLGWSLNL